MLSASTRRALETLAVDYETNAAAIRRTIAILADADHTRARAALPGKLQRAIAGQAPRPKARRARGDAAARLRAQRARTERLLAQFGSKPVSLGDAAAAGGIVTRQTAIASLVRHGLLKRKGAGYVRTARPFHVDPRQAHTPNGAGA